jgi:predicted cation transporter
MADKQLWIIAGLLVVMGFVLLLPFFSKKVEEELEAFLLVMGLISVSISGLWSKHVLFEALIEPVKISVAVLIAGFIFRGIRTKIKKWTQRILHHIDYGLFFFLIIVGLGLLSSLITAIIAALILVEIISALKLERNQEIKLVIITCFSIGLGAVLTPLGEPLATIAVARLKGTPYHADFYFLLRLLGLWVVPAIIGLGIGGAFLTPLTKEGKNTLIEDRPETYKDIIFRAFKVYIFVIALILLGFGFSPLVERYLIHMPVRLLYWINMASAILDNATLTAAEINAKMSLQTIKYLLLGLLAAGGMLIPGNIPNIICAGKLTIKSREWAVFGVPLGLALLAGYFIALSLVG